jgi:hypothetical protein
MQGDSVMSSCEIVRKASGADDALHIVGAISIFWRALKIWLMLKYFDQLPSQKRERPLRRSAY